MKKTRLIVALLMAMLLIFTFALTACPDEGDDGDDTPTYPLPNATINSDGTVTYNYAATTQLQMAVGYDQNGTSISFSALGAEANIVMPTGTYVNGQLKPAWVELSKRLGFSESGQTANTAGFKDVIQHKSNRENEFNAWSAVDFAGVDVLMGTLAKINPAGRSGKLINLANYLDYMPHFKAFLEENPLTYLSILGDTDTGAFYTIPYFDGYDDMERHAMMRIDWVQELLDGTGTYTHTHSSTVAMNSTVVYDEPYMPTAGSVEIDVANAAGTGTTKVSKDYDAVKEEFKNETWYDASAGGNILLISNLYRASTNATYDGLINILRRYIDAAYDGFYQNDRSNLFVGLNGAWDADELVVLLHCIKGSSWELNNSASVAPLFVREQDNNQRQLNLVHLAAQLFGVRGIESRADYLYFDSEGNLVDARQEIDIYEASVRMNKMYREDLIDQNFIGESRVTTNIEMIQGKGFMMFDYVQTQTINNTDDTDFQSVITPVALWKDGTNIVSGEDKGVYMRFTESWRAVKSDGCAVTAAVANNPDKLAAVLRMIDYFYTWEGRVLMSYGPDEYIETDAQGNWVTFNYNGEDHPLINTEITDPDGDFYWNSSTTYKISGNYSNYARRFVGTTLCITEKMQSFEYQLTDPKGMEGAEKVTKAIELGLIKHPLLQIPEGNTNWWYISIPTSIATTSQEDNILSFYVYLSGDTQAFHSGSGKPSVRFNIFTQLIVATYTPGADGAEGVYKLNSMVNGNKGEFKISELPGIVTNSWGAGNYLDFKNDGWARQLAYYNEFLK